MASIGCIACMASLSFGATAVDAQSVGNAVPPPPSDIQRDEIVITATRYGEARTAAETEFSEAEIASHGADDINELLQRLAPLIDGSGEEPVILINGQPAGLDRSILSYPPEALSRIGVLPPEAAAKYGHSSGRRVVNLVLKGQFSGVIANAGLTLPTAGGQHSGTLSVQRMAINGATRWNVQGRVADDSALLKSARNLPLRGAMADGVGFIIMADGGEIDPALSELVGQYVTTAAIPDPPLGRIPILEDFARGANTQHALDPHAFETLISRRRSYSLSVGMTRPIGQFSASLSLNASMGDSHGLRGLPMATLLLPASSPWSPFVDDVMLVRPFAGERPLRSRNSTRSVGFTLNLTGTIRGWQTNASAAYSAGWSDNVFEQGVDVARANALLSAGDVTFDPFGTWDEGLLLKSSSRSRSHNLNTRFNASRATIDLPAGPMTTNITLNAGWNWSHTDRDDPTWQYIDTYRGTRRSLMGEASFNLPFSRRREGNRSLIGDLSVDLSANAQAMTNSRTRTRFGIGVNWSPFANLRMKGSFEHLGTAPSFEQLDDPLVTAVNRIFDYARQEMAEPAWITGGNPALERGSRRNLSVTAQLRPLGNEVLTFNLGYRRRTAKNGISSFPELTPVIEAAFPERVTRDGEGRLVAVDARAINIARDMNEDVTSSVALRFPAGQGPGRGSRDTMQFSLALSHTWQLRNELLTRPGIPAIDQIRTGGQSRHRLRLQTTVARRGLGVNLDGSWSGASRVRYTASGQADRSFRYRQPLMIDAAAFVEPEHILDGTGDAALLKNLRISVDVQNLLNTYRRITSENDASPLGRSRYEMDPLGRTIRLSLRKRF